MLARPTVCATLCLSLLALAPRPASAQNASTDPRVRQSEELFARGDDEFDRRLYAAAARSYEDSWNALEGMSPPFERRYLIRYNWARALEEMGSFARAADIYQLYLDEGGSREDNRAEVEQRIADLRQRPGGSGGGGISPVGPIVLGIGGAALIAGAIVGGVALSDGDAIREACPTLTDCDPALEDQHDSMRTMSGAADALIFGGLAVAAVGVVLLFVLQEGGGEAAVSAGCGPSGCRVRGSF
jgi:hypothetical protein